MKIGFIGSGKVGFSLGKYFSINGLNIEGYYSKSLNSSIEASLFTNSKYFTSIETLISNCDIIFITTNDNSIPDVINQISKFNISGKIICHCSGSYSSEILNHIDFFGAFPYSIHPIYAFSNKYESYKGLTNAVFSLEGHSMHLKLLKNTIEGLGNKVILLSKEDKSSYHLSCAIASNLITSLLHISKDVFCHIGFNEETWINAMMPLIQNNIDNIKKHGLKNSLTGAVARKDFTTINKHIEIVPDEYKIVYVELSKHLTKLCENYNTQDLEELVSTLGG